MALAGCGKSSSDYSSSQYSSEAPVWPVWNDHGSSEEAKFVARNARAICPDSKNCHPAVAQLGIWEETKTSQCTSFLIGSKTLITNSHCIPEAILAPGSSCKDSLFIHFPEVGNYPAESVGCSRVLIASQPKAFSSQEQKNPDYAILDLEREVNRPSIKPTSNGVRNNENITIYKLNPTIFSGLIFGTMEKVNCKAIQNSLANLSFSHSKDPIISLGDCNIIPGNSGSPVLKNTGLGAGIVFATSKMNEKLVREALGEYYVSDTKPANFGYATNFSCVPEIWPGDKMNQCHSTNKAGSTSFFLQQEFNRIAKSWANKNNYGPNWKGSSIAVSVPTLLKSPKLSTNEFHILPVPSCSSPDKPDKKITLPIWRVKYGYNRFLQLQAEVVDAEALLQVALKTLKQLTTITSHSEDGFEIVLFAERLHKCE